MCRQTIWTILLNYLRAPVPRVSARRNACSTERVGHFLRISWCKLVANSVYRQKVPRLRWVVLQLLAQFQDMVVNGPSTRIILIAPNLIKKFISRNDPVGMLRH